MKLRINNIHMSLLITFNMRGPGLLIFICLCRTLNYTPNLTGPEQRCNSWISASRFRFAGLRTVTAHAPVAPLACGSAFGPTRARGWGTRYDHVAVSAARSKHRKMPHKNKCPWDATTKTPDCKTRPCKHDHTVCASPRLACRTNNT